MNFCFISSVPIGVYGIQHYISIIGSLILIPLVIVPAMGGTHVSDFIFFDSFILLCEYCFLIELVAIGGYICSGIYCAFRVWSDYTLAYYFWV